MVACPKCVVNNTLDSAFCKKCGAILPISVIEEEQEKLRELVTKGMESFQSGNLEEAMAISEHSILSNPTYGEAYALKGLVHERRGEYAEALDAYETVVALNPDSTIDKIKLNQLRNAFAQRQAGDPKVDRRSAGLMALAATLLFACVGTIGYGVMQNSAETKKPSVNNTSQQVKADVNPNLQNTSTQTQTQNQAGTPKNPNLPNQTDPDNVPPLGGNADQNGTADTGPRLTNRNRSNRSNTLGSGSTWDVEPIDPIPNGSKTLPNLNNNRGNIPGSKADNTDDPKVQPVNNPGGGITNSVPSGGNTTPPKTDNSGKYEIEVSKKGSDSPGGSEALRHTGNERLKGGDVEGASRDFENAANRGGNSGKLFQRQGQSLQRTGKSAQAREAYQKAIDAYTKEIASGKGDKEAAQAGLNSSRQALKNIKD